MQTSPYKQDWEEEIQTASALDFLTIPRAFPCNSSILPWKLGKLNPAVGTVSVRCPEVQKMTEIEGHKVHQMQQCVSLLERNRVCPASFYRNHMHFLPLNCHYIGALTLITEKEEYWGKKGEIIASQNAEKPLRFQIARYTELRFLSSVWRQPRDMCVDKRRGS